MTTKVYDKIRKLLESKNVSDLRYYMLINNDGFTFNYRGFRFDLRHWVNVYGVETNQFSLMNNATPNNWEKWIEEFTKEIDEEANNILWSETI